MIREDQVKIAPKRPMLSPARQALVAREFHRLADQWVAETGHLSDLGKAFNHPAYLAIIRLGMDAVPLLLDELQSRPTYWFKALREITGEDAATPEMPFRQKVEAWLAWGKERGYLS